MNDKTDPSAPLGRFSHRDRLDVADAIGGADLTDAERARIMLASKGLKVEVIEL